jgi:hypothetical protein
MCVELVEEVTNQCTLTIQYYGALKFLHYTKANEFITHPHFAFLPLESAEVACMEPRCKFKVEDIEGTTFRLRAASATGESLVGLMTQDAPDRYGFIASTMPERNDDTEFIVKIDEVTNAVRMVGKEEHHLSCVAIQNDLGNVYEVLGTRCTDPEPTGRFVFYRVG